ncbi:AraC family transcriptional regulator [Antarcticibacterium sp. 1MA-6-2]|uniref:helix-turn-helix domain-containing protein n=1 Tax=Antarcticibacterium sp. 1MA-6-2 TaxID=2908210 RepID=UPI001F3EEA4E|nr:AraC family transcriptional regulator [Antarcticibacterium sp. 1MA-6-2]UJH92810.1 AraC family transcriptional regulator [Antarcticibacterium sp. 1MA-6-2]
MLKRPEEITIKFNEILDGHLKKIVSGEIEVFPEIHEIAGLMCIHPTHLSNTIKEVTGKAPCDVCNEKTIAAAKKLLSDPGCTIREVALRLTFEPSNFTKYFKRHTKRNTFSIQEFYF